MHRKLSIATATLMAIFGGTTANAEGMRSSVPSTLDKTLRMFRGQFNVEYVQNRLTLNNRTDGPLGIPNCSPQEVQRTRSAGRDNDFLLYSFKRKGVAGRDLVNAYQAADGSVAFYVR